MLKRLVFTILVSSMGYLYAQDSIQSPDIVDSRYLEDQFYTGAAYNVLLNKPNDVIQRNLSYNFQLGFIKDIPLNSRRNIGFGLGVGYGTNSYYSNIIAEDNGTSINYRLPVPTDSLRRTKFETHAIAFPLEIRWRTSNPVDYKFWRVYGGIKAEYLFSRRSKLVSDNSDLSTSFKNDDISQWQLGLTLNFGYNTWNIHLYYSLNPLLDNAASINGEAIEIRPLRIGVIFYIL
ncbi:MULTISPECIES: porin family protein [unclassified Croceitalea]|uniref:porin family protein n=1 Tax=unclassified Croceitalea TaxID=2632280 RepID=UPI0030DDA600